MRVLGILHLLYEALRDLPISKQRLCRHPYGSVNQQAIRIPTAVVSNVVRVRLLSLEWCTAMLIISIVHLMYEGPWDLLICVQRLYGNPYGNESQVIHMPKVVVPNHHLIWYKHIIRIIHLLHPVPRYCTVCIHKLWHQYVDISPKCIQPYSGGTKMPFASVFSLFWCVQPCAILE